MSNNLFQPIDVRTKFPILYKEISFRINDVFYNRQVIACVLHNKKNQVFFCHKNLQSNLEKILNTKSFSLNKGQFAISKPYQSYFYINDKLFLPIVGSYETRDKVVFSTEPNLKLIKKLAQKHYLVAMQKLLDFAPYINVDNANKILKEATNEL